MELSEENNELDIALMTESDLPVILITEQITQGGIQILLDESLDEQTEVFATETTEDIASPNDENDRIALPEKFTLRNVNKMADGERKERFIKAMEDEMKKHIIEHKSLVPVSRENLRLYVTRLRNKSNA